MSEASVESAGEADREAEEDRIRLAVLAASVPLMMLCAPLVLPFDGDRSLLASTRREPGVAAVLVAIFAWPVFVGALGLRRALARRAPGKVAFAVPAVLHLLAAAGGVLVMGAALFSEHRARETPGIWIGLGIGAATVLVLGRGFRRAGWDRWAQVVVGVWSFHAMGTIVLWSERHSPFDPSVIGSWVVLFALSAAAPAIGWLLWPKRR